MLPHIHKRKTLKARGISLESFKNISELKIKEVHPITVVFCILHGLDNTLTRQYIVLLLLPKQLHYCKYFINFRNKKLYYMYYQMYQKIIFSFDIEFPVLDIKCCFIIVILNLLYYINIKLWYTIEVYGVAEISLHSVDRFHRLAYEKEKNKHPLYQSNV